MLWGFTIFRGSKNQFIGGDCLKWGAWAVYRFKEGLSKKGRGGLYEGLGGGVKSFCNVYQKSLKHLQAL